MIATSGVTTIIIVETAFLCNVLINLQLEKVQRSSYFQTLLEEWR